MTEITRKDLVNQLFFMDEYINFELNIYIIITTITIVDYFVSKHNLLYSKELLSVSYHLATVIEDDTCYTLIDICSYFESNRTISSKLKTKILQIYEYKLPYNNIIRELSVYDKFYEELMDPSDNLITFIKNKCFNNTYNDINISDINIIIKK